MRLQRYIKYPIPTKSFHEKLLKTFPRVACIHPIANNLQGWKKFLSDCVNSELRHPGAYPSRSQNHPCSSVFLPISTPKTPQEQGKRDQHTRFSPCVSLALPLDPMRRVLQPSRNTPNEGLETPSTKGLKRSYRERKYALTENALAIIPRASRRSYRQRKGDLTKSIKTHTESVTVGPEVRPLMPPRGL